MTTYRPTSFACGTCHQPLAFATRSRFGVLYAAHYVHAGTRRYRCRRVFGPNAQTAPLDRR